jgi:hypothetical protein
MTLKSMLSAYGIIIGIIIAIVVAISGFCWEYSIDYWLAYTESPKDFPLWGACLMAFVPGLGQMAIPAAAITFIVSFFL